MKKELFAYRLAFALKQAQLEGVDVVVQQGETLWVQTGEGEVLKISIESVSKGEFEREAKEFYKGTKGMLRAHQAELEKRKREIVEEVARLLEEHRFYGLESVERVPGGLIIRTFDGEQLDLRVLFGIA